MEVQELAPRLWRWTAPHPEWKPDDDWEREVGCVYYEGPEAVCLVDPLVPEGEEERFWRALDRDVERAAKPVAVLLTVPWHRRSAGEVAARYGTSPTQEPPEGVEAVEIPWEDERELWIPEHRALVSGDVLIGDDDGGVRVCPATWISRDGVYPPAFLAALRQLLDLPVELVVVSHGRPVLADGRAALADALARVPSAA